ncbi:type II toxin-antitoxin system mRNA interferase toxin, RelE/StbE family [Leptolyngbya sp. CCY15150]|uniref:type II toxin-antitoxin system RelE/ParE family toxin n=1 Tax=Leptolyngbya sp. CCY15150 TaxID=2767772 RepID=UPI00194DEEBC|nr:type II toxin-antitoxin system mRNA interferase toxin, RelE/StbE family [Leptolyngbya sp. CCY15150]
MRQIGWTPKSLRAFKRLVKRNPDLRSAIEQTLNQLSENPFHPSLQTHKLTGDLAGIWSASIDYKLRVLFEFVNDVETQEQSILLLNLGSHDDVY